MSQKARHAKHAEQRVTAEDAFVYKSIEEGRAKGLPDATIRDTLIAAGLTAALIRYGWLAADGQPHSPKPNVATRTGDSADTTVEPKGADGGDNPFWLA